MFRKSYSSSSNRHPSSRGGGFNRSRFGGGASRGSTSGRGGGRNVQARSPRPASRGKSTFDVTSFVNKVVTKPTVTQFSPKHKFTDFGLDKELEEVITQKGYTDPTPIQDGIIPLIMAGRDVVGLANTGTGKTAAFLLPLIHQIRHQSSGRILVLTPTRELALQIQQEFRSFVPKSGMRAVVCVGGANIGTQIRDMRHHHQFVIGTPGRILDLMKRGVLKLDDVKIIVLDEADRMLDMGFIGDMRFVMSKMPQPRRTLFFSATMSPEISRLINEFLHDPVTVSVATQDTPTNIEQDVVKLNGRAKADVLNELLQDPAYKKVLVFGRTKHGVEKLSKILVNRGVKADSIHGNKSQGGRQRSLKQFKEGAIQVLVATDVAARGLDISNVTHVINFDPPESREDYIHRIGRTGRGDQLGKALTFID